MGKIYQEADKERARAEQELEAAKKAVVDAEAKLKELATGDFLDSAEKLVTLQKAL